MLKTAWNGSGPERLLTIERETGEEKSTFTLTAFEAACLRSAITDEIPTPDYTNADMVSQFGRGIETGWHFGFFDCLKAMIIGIIFFLVIRVTLHEFNG